MASDEAKAVVNLYRDVKKQTDAQQQPNVAGDKFVSGTGAVLQQRLRNKFPGIEGVSKDTQNFPAEPANSLRGAVDHMATEHPKTK